MSRCFYGFSLADHVPHDHLLRSIDRFVDLGDIREHLRPYYRQDGQADPNADTGDGGLSEDGSARQNQMPLAASAHIRLFNGIGRQRTVCLRGRGETSGRSSRPFSCGRGVPACDAAALQHQLTSFAGRRARLRQKPRATCRRCPAPSRRAPVAVKSIDEIPTIRSTMLSNR